jgi:hypothetical protein
MISIVSPPVPQSFLLCLIIWIRAASIIPGGKNPRIVRGPRKRRPLDALCKNTLPAHIVRWARRQNAPHAPRPEAKAGPAAWKCSNNPYKNYRICGILVLSET